MESDQNQDNQATEKLFVGNLSWTTTSESLGAAFAPFGTVVEAVVVSERETGRSKGYGFVTMTSPEEAQAAKDALNDQDLDGRPIRIDFARPRVEGDRDRN